MTPTDSLHRIQTFARAVNWLFAPVALLMPLLVLLVMGRLEDHQLSQQILGHQDLVDQIPAGRRALVLALSLLPVLCLSAGLFAMRPALTRMQAGQVFTASAFRGLRQFAAALVGASILKILVTPLISVLLTMSQPEKTLAVSVGFDSVQFLIFGLAVWMLAWVFAEGQALASENEQFI